MCVVERETHTQSSLCVYVMKTQRSGHEEEYQSQIRAAVRSDTHSRRAAALDAGGSLWADGFVLRGFQELFGLNLHRFHSVFGWDVLQQSREIVSWFSAGVKIHIRFIHKFIEKVKLQTDDGNKCCGHIFSGQKLNLGHYAQAVSKIWYAK